MFLDSVINSAIIQAYLETNYRVQVDHSFTLHVGTVSSDLLRLYGRHKVDCAAFITAWNPFSQNVSEAENRERQQLLATELTRRNLSFFKGFGLHPSNNWIGEQSFLVLGLNLEAAKTMGMHFEQNAIVWCGPDALPQLIVLR